MRDFCRNPRCSDVEIEGGGAVGDEGGEEGGDERVGTHLTFGVEHANEGEERMERIIHLSGNVDLIDW